MKPPQSAEGKGQDDVHLMPSAHQEPRWQGSITCATTEVGYSSRRLNEEGLVSIVELLPALLEVPFPVFLGSCTAHS